MNKDLKGTLQALGVSSIEALKNNQPMSMDDDGCIKNTFAPGDEATLKVTVKVGSSLIPFTGKKGETPTRADWDLGEEPMTLTYTRNVKLEKNRHGVVYIDFYEGSSIRLLRVCADGEAQVWEISMVSEGQNVFVALQAIYDAKLCKQDDKVVCPQSNFLASWPEMVQFAGSILESRNGFGGLTKISSYQAPQVQELALAENEGVVKYWSIGRGVGSIKTQRGEAKIHWSQVEGFAHKRIAQLKEGQKVTFKGLRSPAGSQAASRKTGFQHEAVGIALAKKA